MKALRLGIAIRSHCRSRRHGCERTSPEIWAYLAARSEREIYEAHAGQLKMMASNAPNSNLEIWPSYILQ